MRAKLLSVATLLCVADVVDAQRIPDGAFRVGWTDTRATRREQAAQWLKEIEEIDKQIPTLSPAEAAWIRLEYYEQLAGNDGRYTARAIRAMQSREYVSRESRTFTAS